MIMEKYADLEGVDVHGFLLEQLSDELEGAECYHKFAVKAKHHGDLALSTLLLKNAKEELGHFESLMEIIEKNIPNLKANPLYPLLRDLEDWAADLQKEIAAFR